MRACQALAFLLLLALPAALPAQGARRPLRLDDLFRLKTVRDPQVSPDGQWVAYVVSQLDSVRDKSNADVWMVSWDGTRTVQLTHSLEGESSPRWSPDNTYLSFTATRGDSKNGSQVWVLDRLGGEARQLTKHKGGVSSYQWSPDATRLLFLAQDPDSAELGADSAKKSPRPIVVDRYAFKRDGDGYLNNRRTHVYVYDIAKDTVAKVTTGPWDDSQPEWSPDGRSIAFVSERGKEPDRENNSDVFIVEARAGGAVRQMTTFDGPDSGPLAFSPDGKWLAYTQGSEAKWYAYSKDHLAVVPAAGGAPRVVTASLDRSVGDPVWNADGASLTMLLEDDRAVHIARIDVATGRVDRVLEGRRVVQEIAEGPGGKLAVLAGVANRPNEIHVFEQGALRQLTHANDAWVQEVQLATVEDFSAKGKDGTIVNGLLARPAGSAAGRALPMLLRIHGGPAAQDQHAFNFERELFAANGYAVINVNYRGSTGRGSAYQQAIYADWGNKEVQDLLAAVDHMVATGVADPNRLGIGGWSYGGILTNYTIATDTRFKAAISGAGSSMQLTMYGTDQYIYQYETELGAPWKNPKAWEKVSYPFYKADKIRTPTLFMGGKDDDNVPITGGEQMYQALKSLGVETQLVVYPGQNHGISLPSFQKDRLARYLAWYDGHLRPATQ
ncbi:MAG: S9 family peptidase [Cytophagaceae bacterium]|nr:S9 family peptidase [Gemmatimonadaceae bacterium]